MPNWRWRCAKGHATTQSRSDGYYCESCQQRYAGSLYDAKHTDFPVEETVTIDTVSPHDVLTALDERCDELRTWAKASHLDIERTEGTGKALAQLRERGLVEQMERSEVSWWRPTERGRRCAGGAGLDRDSGGRLMGVADD